MSSSHLNDEWITCGFHGGESRDLNDRVHGISCRYSDKASKQTYHAFLFTQPIFTKQSIHTSLLFEANVHLKVTPQYAVVFHSISNKYCFRLFSVFRLCSDFCGKLLLIIEKHLDEWLPGIMRRYVHFIA